MSLVIKFLFYDLIMAIIKSALPALKSEQKKNIFLKYQVKVLRRQLRKKPQFNRLDRAILANIGLSIKKFRRSCFIFTPETLFKWKRNFEKSKWTLKQKGRPRTRRNIKALIIEMKTNNSLWGVRRIFGELKKLKIKISVSTIRNILRDAGFDPSVKQSPLSWKEFLKQHKEIWAFDFFTVETTLLQTCYIFVIIEIHSRKLIDVVVLNSPTAQLVHQVICNNLAFRDGPTLMLRDRDPKYGKNFNSKIKELYGTRVIGSIQRESTNHFLCITPKQIKKVVSSYKKYYNEQRPHQGISQKIPIKPKEKLTITHNTPTSVKNKRVLGGLHHHYFRAA